MTEAQEDLFAGRFTKTIGGVTVRIPIRTVSELNQREHWAKRHRRRANHRWNTAMVMSQYARPVLPCAFVLRRVAPRLLDGHDNLAASCKACVDALSTWLGVDDADPRVSWHYEQRKGAPREYAVEVEWRPATSAG